MKWNDKEVNGIQPAYLRLSLSWPFCHWKRRMAIRSEIADHLTQRTKCYPISVAVSILTSNCQGPCFNKTIFQVYEYPDRIMLTIRTPHLLDYIEIASAKCHVIGYLLRTLMSSSDGLGLCSDGWGGTRERGGRRLSGRGRGSRQCERMF